MTSDAFAPARFEDGRAMLLAGVRRHHPFAESGQNIAGQWRQLQALGPLPGQLGTTRYGVMCGHDPRGIEFMCGVEVDAFEGLPGDLGRMRIGPEHYAVFLHPGPVATIRATWERIMREWLPGSGYQSAQKPDFEVYDQQTDPVSGTGGVEIWVALLGDPITRQRVG